MSIEACQVGDCAKDPSGKAMAPWTFDVKFPLGTKFTFGSLTFVAVEDGDLRMLPPGEATEHTALSSALSGTQADLDFFDEPYIRTVKLVRGIPVVTTILRPCAGASSSSSSALSSDQGSSEDYPQIGGQHLWKLRRHQPPHLYGGSERRSAPP
jgi:hypothetical protein